MTEENQQSSEANSSEQDSTANFSKNDRVKRISGSGPAGTVEEVREETNTSATDRPRAKKYLVRVRWDSGTVSYFAPESLESVAS